MSAEARWGAGGTEEIFLNPCMENTYTEDLILVSKLVYQFQR